jgi:ParB family transcriptional regulator, chromosome partitioning protein
MSSKSNRLGRGLEALIPQIPPEEEKTNRALDTLPVSRIHTNPKQPRSVFDRQGLEDLKKSIVENGVIQPVTVRKTDGGFEIIAGERRLRAVVELGYERIPAYVMDVESEEKMLELALVENVQREDLNPIELAKAYDQLQTEYRLSQEEVAQKVGKDRATVANFIRLLKLPDVIQESLSKSEISMGHARAFMGLGSRSDQIKVWKKTLAKGWSVRKVEDEVRLQTETAKQPGKPKSGKRHPYFGEAEDRIRTALGTQVKIVASGKGGRIEIRYFSEEELDRLIELFQNIKD